MSTIVLEAESRQDVGKGASRRLRRLENKIPAVVYGGDKNPQSIHLIDKQVRKQLENESIFSSVFNLKVDGKVQHVVLKSLQRHPYKPLILHMDFQRVSAKDILVRQIPLHFINEQESKGVKAGGILTHNMTQVEVRCQVKNLPGFIEVDLINLDLNGVLHLSDLALPKDVRLTADLTDSSHDSPIVSIHVPKVAAVEEEEAPEEEEPTPEEETKGEEEPPKQEE